MSYLTDVKLFSEIFQKLKEQGASEITFDFQRNDVEIIYERWNRCWSVYGKNIEEAVLQFKYHTEQEI